MRERKPLKNPYHFTFIASEDFDLKAKIVIDISRFIRENKDLIKFIDRLIKPLHYLNKSVLPVRNDLLVLPPQLWYIIGKPR